MSQTLQQIFVANPITTNTSTDLIYFSQSPYTAGNDAAMTYADFEAQFAPAGSVASGTINQLAWYSATGAVVSGLATANDGTLITSAAGVPSISSTLPSAVQNNITLLGVIDEAFRLTPSVGAARYIILDGATAAATGTLQLQAGGGSASFGGGLIMYSASHATKPGWVSAGLSSQGGNFFTVNNQGTGVGTDVFTVSSAGNVVANGSLTAASATLTAALTGANGGTGIANTGKTITIGGNLSTIGAFTSAFTMTANTAVTFPTSGTLATTASASGIVNSGLINQLAFYAAAGTTVSGLATANNGTLITSAGGVPSISSTLPSAVQNNITLLGVIAQPVVVTGSSVSLTTNAASFSSAFSGVTTTHLFTDASGGCLSVDGENNINFRTGGKTGTIRATIGPTGLNVIGSLTTSQTAGIIGTTTNNNANAGSVGEVISSLVAVGSPVSVTSSTNTEITNIELTAGDWDVTSMTGFIPAATTNVVRLIGYSSIESVDIPAANFYNILTGASGGTVYGGEVVSFNPPMRRISLSATTIIYLGCRSSHSVSTLTAYGEIIARRVR